MPVASNCIRPRPTASESQAAGKLLLACISPALHARLVPGGPDLVRALTFLALPKPGGPDLVSAASAPRCARGKDHGNVITGT